MIEDIKNYWKTFLCIGFNIHFYCKPYKYEVLGYTPKILNGTKKNHYIIRLYKKCEICDYVNIKKIKFKTNKILFDNNSVINEFLKYNK